MVTKEEKVMRRLGYLEVGIKIYTLIYIKQITNKGLLYSTGNYSQHFIATYKGKESEKESIYVCIYIYIYMYITKPLCCTPETNIYYKSSTLE